MQNMSMHLSLRFDNSVDSNPSEGNKTERMEVFSQADLSDSALAILAALSMAEVIIINQKSTKVKYLTQDSLVFVLMEDSEMVLQIGLVLAGEFCVTMLTFFSEDHLLLLPVEHL